MLNTLRRNSFGLGLWTTALAGLATGANAAVVISKEPTKHVSCANRTCTATGLNAVLNVSDLKHLLRHSLTISTGTVSDDIVFSVNFGWSNNSNLALVAQHSISIEKPMSVEGDGGLSIRVNQAGTGGILCFPKDGSVSFWSSSGRLRINNDDYLLESNLSQLVADIGNNFSGNFALAASYDAANDGTYTASPIHILNGRFEGLGNRISNLKIDDETSSDYVGLFHELYPAAAIENVVLTNAHVTSGSNSAVGVLAGDNQGSVARSYTSGSVTGLGSFYAGGLAGYNSGSITQSEAVADVSGNFAGGLVGDNDGTISNSFAMGTVNAAAGPNGPYGGGLVGQANTGSVSNSYSTGAVTGNASATLGGSLGANFSTGNSSIYWDTDTSGQTLGCGVGNCSGVIGQSTAQLQAGLPLGLDPSIWGEKRKINGGFPFLRTLRTSP